MHRERRARSQRSPLLVYGAPERVIRTRDIESVIRAAKSELESAAKDAQRWRYGDACAAKFAVVDPDASAFVVPAPVHAVVGASDDGMELSLVEGEGRAVACGGGGLEAGCWGPGVEIACCGGYTDAVGGISI